ncbi:MAG TPA: Crp/Fnr family transcriptional regulator [Blastocatellia bacterium]|nr:Crp/Fnr family transcriptional regulator [Blastocatellia bacterium]
MSRSPIHNRILAALPREAYDRMALQMETVRLPSGKVLYHVGDLIREVYFPDRGMASLLAATADGAAIEVGLVGKEGMLGLPIVLGMPTTPYHVVIEVPGTAMRMNASLLREACARHELLRDRLLRYTYTLLTQISQSAVCHHFHTLEERLCRRLLTTCDRAQANTFRLTQERLSQILGARRQSVSEVAAALQKAGLIHYFRGQMTIIDREGLEALACECYEIVKEAYNRGLIA